MGAQKGCHICPRDCGVDRLHGQKGACGVAGEMVVCARAALHFWEEPCISGETGSGAVFFSGCPLGCVYCQNDEIAHGAGKEIPVSRLAEIFLELQGKGAANLNLVTPTHYTPQILEALRMAKQRGLSLPVAYNCGGYERVGTLRELEGMVDIYLTDFKYMDSELSACYSRAADYPEVAKAALAEMVRQVGAPQFDGEGMMQKGVIVRHLLLPGHVKNAREVVRYVHGTYGNLVYLSLMSQYTPLPKMASFPELNRRVTRREYGRLVDDALSLGVELAYVQEGGAARESFIPAFDFEGV